MFGGQDCLGDKVKDSDSFCYGVNCCPDESDYIGCFEKTGGLISSGKYLYSDITPCYCIGYCNSLNYSLAGAYKK